MFARRLATLGLLLLSLSLSSNLSGAVRSHQVLLQLLRQATDINDVYGLFEELGDDFKIYANLRVISDFNCTPDRILFMTNVKKELGAGAQHYVMYYVNQQRRLCEMTFVYRLRRQYVHFLQNWPGKEHFTQFLEFVDPWPSPGSDMHDFADSIIENIKSYADKRMEQSPWIQDRNQVYDQLVQSSAIVNRMFAGFIASLKYRDFRPNVGDDLEHALKVGKIAEAILALAAAGA